MIEEILKSHLIPVDNFICGYADLTGFLDKKFKGYNYAVSIGRQLDNVIIDKIIDGPTREYDRNTEQSLVSE